MDSNIKNRVAMALAIALLASTFSTAVAKYESFDSAIAAPARSTFSTNSSTTGTVQLDHSLSSTHKNNSALKISWSSTSGNTVYYSVAVKELDGAPQFTAGTESGTIIGGYDGIFQKKESVTIAASDLPKPGKYIKVFIKGFAADKTTVTDEGAFAYFLIEEAPSSVGNVVLDHSLSSIHKNDSALKISWSSTSGNTIYYSVAVKELDGAPQFTADTESGTIIDGYNGTFQKNNLIDF